MKLSLAWVFSHIKNTEHKLSTLPFLQFQSEFEKGNFFERVSATVAEIEHVQRVTYSLNMIFIGNVVKKESQICLELPELNKELVLPFRADLQVHDSCLIIKNGDSFAYLTLADLYAEKEGLVPAVWVVDDKKNGSWKQDLPAWDYIVTFDNKALTHRPDLWGHRGFAREIAALYNLELIPEEYILAQKPIRSFLHQAPAVAGNSIALENNNLQQCKRIAGLTIDAISYYSSCPDMVFKLCAINAKPINAIVDCTNYVMYDIGQPMHAFDAQHIQGGVLKVEAAQSGEKLQLLDGNTITLSAEDIVLCDTKNTLSLAGIMGGKSSSISSETRSLFIESACYVPSTIRKSSLRHKVRSESSTRFEKSLDPLYNTHALTRFLHLLDIHDIPYHSAQAIISLGEVPQEKVIHFSHAFLQERVGTSVSAEHIHSILQKLGFGVQQKNNKGGIQFSVIVPSFRATKDISLPEDILEEVARFIGFNNLSMQLPLRVMKPFSVHYSMTRRALKRLCAFGFSMHEVSNYAFYDNQFLEKIGLTCEPVYTVANPVSEHWTHLVSSLIPHFLKNIEQNIHLHGRMSFFEMNTLWKRENDKPCEKTVLSGIWYAPYELNFYDFKEKVTQIFKLLAAHVIWRKPVSVSAWYHPYQTAELVYNDTVIGYAGMIRPAILKSVAPGEAFAFEFDLDILIHAPNTQEVYKAISPFQPLTTDISLLVPFSISVDMLEQAIAHCDARIYHIQVIDSFEKPEWKDQRSITMRYIAVDDEKTFSKEEIDQLRTFVIQAVTRLGATVR